MSHQGTFLWSRELEFLILKKLFNAFLTLLFDYPLHYSSEDTWRIIIATDTHLGYLERDPLRRDDSFEAFDEVLALAEREDVRKHNLESKDI